MKIFITGATGYIGNALLLRAIEKGYKVNAIVRRKSSCTLHHPSVKFFEGDVTDFDGVVEAMKGCDIVFHTAALTQLWHPDRSVFYKVNVGGTRNVLEAAVYHGIKKLVFTSSCGVEGPSHKFPVSEDDPRTVAFENDYEISKHCAEELVREYSRKGLFTVIVSLPRIYGPGLKTAGNPLTQFILNTVRRRFAFVINAANVHANYAYINDIVEGHFLAMEKGLGGEKYNLGGVNISYRELFSTIRQAAGKKIRFIPIPGTFLKLVAALVYGFYRLRRKHTHVTPSVVDRLCQNRAISCEKAIRQLGYRITPLIQGLKETIHHSKNHRYG